MAITRDFFKGTVYPRLRSNGEFRLALLDECIECLHTGDAMSAKSMLTHLITATGGFEEVASLLGCAPAAIRQALAPDDIASNDAVLDIIAALRTRENAQLSVTG